MKEIMQGVSRLIGSQNKVRWNFSTIYKYITRTQVKILYMQSHTRERDGEIVNETCSTSFQSCGKERSFQRGVYVRITLREKIGQN